jgi:LEA14-like dessication related protein
MNTRLLAASLCGPGLPWLLLLMAAAPGCSALNLQQPTVSFRSAKVSDLSPAGLNADFDVDIQNPNVFEIPVNGAAYKLSLSGVQVVEGDTKPTGSVPAQGTLPVTLPVHLQFQQLLGAENEIAKSGGNVPFDFDGSLEFSPGKIPLGNSIKVPLHFSGTLPLRDAVNSVIRDPATLADLLRDPLARKFLESALGHKLLGGFFDR